jgi:hypothetical protein
MGIEPLLQRLLREQKNESEERKLYRDTQLGVGIELQINCMQVSEQLRQLGVAENQAQNAGLNRFDLDSSIKSANG